MATNHGSSPAAWTIVTITIVGFIVGGLALVLGRPAAVVTSGGIVLAGLVLGKIMQLMGLGQRTFASSYRPAGRMEEGTLPGYLSSEQEGWKEGSRVERPRAEELHPPKASPRPQGRSGAREHVGRGVRFERLRRGQEAPQGRRPRGSQTDIEPEGAR